MPTQPYSLTAEQNRNGANGFTRYESVSEFVDNSLDANAPGHVMAAICEKDSSKGYHIGYDLGDGAANLKSFYGIGTTVCKKRGATRGLKNYGHGAAVGRFNPDRVIHITRHSGAALSSMLIYNTGALYRAIDDAKRMGDCDYRRIDVELGDSMFVPYTGGGLTEEIRNLLEHLRSQIADKSAYYPLEEVLTNILANEQPTFHLMIMEFEVFPTEMITEIKDALHAFRRDYYPALKAGRFIEYLAPNLDRDPPTYDSTRTNASNAVDHMGPLSRARLAGKIELRSDVATATNYLRFTVASYGTGVAPAEFWLSCKDGDKLFYDGHAGPGPFTTAPPAGWEAALPVGDYEGISFMCSVISQEEENIQKDKIDSKTLGTTKRAGVNELRGVQLCYQDRNLGLPLYNEANWGDRRNVGGLRVQLSTTDPNIAERFFGIKTKKHSANFDGLHPLMRRFLNWIVQRVIISQYSYTANYSKKDRGDKDRGGCPGVSDWNFPYFCALMLNAKAKKPAVAPLLPVSSASSVASSDHEGEEIESDNHIEHVLPVPAPAPAHAPAPSLVLTESPVAATSRVAAISLRQVAIELLRINTQLSASNLAELAETASTTAKPKLASKLKILFELIETMKSEGLTYSA
jgi:hypothetical protein